jgi:hypothetical protein
MQPSPQWRRALAARVVAAGIGAVLLAGSLVPAAGQGAASDSGADARLSESVIFARPNAGKTELGRNLSWGTRAASASPACHGTLPICVHWTTNGDHAPLPADGDNDDIPDQVERTLAATATSWQAIVGRLGFRAPLPDGRSTVNGGDNRFDVYLADTGSVGLAGYTSSDDPRLDDGSTYRFRDVSAFVVVDNDFDADQFKRGTAIQNLRVTAAHELFHAVQMAYDFREDPWLVEGTAAWVEDEVFDDPNLNRWYLQRNSPLTAPGVSLDRGRQGYEYGSWIFFRYLSERFGRGFVAKIWRLADDSPQQVSAKELETYSLRAVRRAVAREQRDFSRVFADFARANLAPGRSYNEGAAYPVPFSPRLALGPRGEDTGWLGTPVDHLASQYVTFVPADSAPPGRRLLVRVDGPPRGFAPQAQVVVRHESGKQTVRVVRLNKRGNGEVRVDFGRSTVTSVDVALVNASTRYEGCFKRSTSYSCRGSAKDDDRLFKVRARVL